MSFTCSLCGNTHDDLPHIGSDHPSNYWDVAESERGRRIKLTPDTCVIDDESFFVHGVIEIPVHDYEHEFGFGVWASLKRENFYKYLEFYDSDTIGPFFGWLCTPIAFYSEDTLSLKTTVHFRGQGLRPLITLNQCDHRLYFDQVEGISFQRAWEIIHYYEDRNTARQDAPAGL